jgi:5-formyltetrahydrofolate cyclo-ligase
MTKETLRRFALDRRALQPEREALSQVIVETLFDLPEFAAAGTVLLYLDARTEVRTRHALPDLLSSGKRIVVPWCEAGELKLFRLGGIDELASGSYGIMEPRVELRLNAARLASPEELDLLVVPGVAFDRRGGRLGHGRGYFDKLLAGVRRDAALIGLAFDCQIFDDVPIEIHDVSMHYVITETTTYRCVPT